MDTNRRQVLDAYPKFREQYIRTFSKMIEIRKGKGLETKWDDGQEVYDWWIER